MRQLASRQEWTRCAVRIEGILLWVSQSKDQFIIQDDAGGVAVNLNVQSQSAITEGQSVRFEGNCQAGRGQINCLPVLENDGLHDVQEASGTVFLPRGLHPIRVEWFNGPERYALNVEWKGPAWPRQAIPSASLFRREANWAGKTNRLGTGLNYRCYEGNWESLPDFSPMPISKSGSVSNFDLTVRTRNEYVGLVFDGFLDAPRDGVYTFWTKSDDGSRLTVGDPASGLTVLSTAKLPPPNQLVPGQFVSEEQNFQWSEMEGTVTFVSDISMPPYLELSSAAGRTCVKFAQADPGLMRELLGCRIRVKGICLTGFSVEKQSRFVLLAPNIQQLAVLEFSPANWVANPIVPIGSLSERDFGSAQNDPVHVGGRVVTNVPEKGMVIQDLSGRILVETAEGFPRPGTEVEALGHLSGAGSNVVLAGGFYRNAVPRTRGDAASLPLLTLAAQVKGLNRAEAQLGYPVRIRGVITARVESGFAIQDSTWSVWLKFAKTSPKGFPKVGQFCEIQGNTTMLFAPSILVSDWTYAGAGILPEPIRPTWDELINGSLDTQFIEIQGIVTGSGINNIVLLTREGKLNIQLFDFGAPLLKGLEGALVRLRGVSSPERDASQQFIVSRQRLYNASVSVDEPAPRSPFEIPPERVSDLLYFNSRANSLQRVRITGQIVHERHGEYFLMDGTNGLRFHPKSLLQLASGDLADVVGFPDLDQPSPALREALARSKGKTALPAARKLDQNTMLDSRNDATLVHVEARAVSASVNLSEQVLELQLGNRNFLARLQAERGHLPDIPAGSRLALTGVYAGLGGDWGARRKVDSFELLLNAPADVQVLEKPSWWTVQHIAIVLGSMALIMFGALVWISVLRRQVEERTHRLAAEIQRREQIEHLRVLEAERARIAQDLHDDLGATLTQIRFLSAVEMADTVISTATRDRLQQVSDKSLQMVTSLDEIVWAVNPANDSVRSLAAYLRHMAAELFRATTLNCRFDVDKSLPGLPLTSETRHNLYLTAREALNNSAKHAQATELWLRIHWRDQTLHIVVEDNGCGFAHDQLAAGGNGLTNMRQRMEKIGGSFNCDTHPGSGTIYRITLPFK